MKWTYLISQKMKVTVSLTIIIAMVLLTNFLNKRRFTVLQESLSSVYEDRLIVEIYIYKISTFLNEKNILIQAHNERNRQSTEEKLEAMDDSVSTIINAYKKTVLTAKEAQIFDDFKYNLKQLSHLEDSILSVNEPKAIDGTLSMKNKWHALLAQNLSQLSDIQYREGKRLTEKSVKIISSAKITLQFELVILIVIGLIVQALIFSSKSTITKFRQNPRLN